MHWFWAKVKEITLEVTVDDFALILKKNFQQKAFNTTFDQ